MKPKNLCFSKASRLLTSSQYNQVFQKASKMRTSEIIVLARSNDLPYPRLGLTIAKKQIRKAHDRNLIKRLFRESFRLQQYSLPKMDFVILVRNNILLLDNHNIFQQLAKIWDKYIQLEQLEKKS